MIEEGGAAPVVTLPGYVDGERTRVDLGEYVGEGIVVLAFYPADFNPGCTVRSADLDDLDLFTMQKDVSVFGVSPDSTYSHEAFAERYSLNVPLLSDPDREAARAYGVELETDVGESLVRRAVFVVDHRGTVRYAWATDDLEQRVDVAPVKQAVGDIGGDETALERYRVGYDDYTEGREAFTAAMRDYSDREWPAAQNAFEDAEAAFGATADHFDTAVRFAEAPDFEAVVDRSEEKAGTLRHAAQWLAESADAFASGEGARGTQYREDAQPLVDAAKAIPDPVPPVKFDLVDGGVTVDDSVAVAVDGDREPGSRGDDGDLELAFDVDVTTGDRAGGSDLTDGDGESGTDADADEPVELDLADPTEGDEDADADADERADWDIPGQ